MNLGSFYFRLASFRSRAVRARSVSALATCETCQTRSSMTSRSVAVYLFVCVAALLTFSASASAQTSDWTFCAWEGATCTFSGTQEVRYGANGSYFYRTLSNGTACTNSVFGDPSAGTVKDCAVRSDWTFCAAEGGFCAFAGTQQVRYGANGVYSYRTLSGGTACTNSVFGDPIVGTAKQCHIGAASTSPPPSPSLHRRLALSRRSRVRLAPSTSSRA